jgi:uncharacterized caspase-like protein
MAVIGAFLICSSLVGDLVMDKWAVIVGVNKYEHVKSLKYCVNDVSRVKEAFCDLLEFPEDHITELSDASKTKPGRDAIFHELGRISEERVVKPDDLLVFYFTGHGMINKKDGKDYLLPRSASPYILELTALKMEDVVGLLKKTECNNLVMFIDACREEIGGARGVMSIGEDSKSICAQSGIVTFFSCYPKDFSYEISALKHGSFTYNILEALRIPGCSTVEEIDAFLRTNVPLTNSKYKKPVQTPYCIVEPTTKNKMAIFVSRIMQDEILSRLDVIIGKLGALGLVAGADIAFLERCIDIVEQAKQGFQDERHRIVVDRIEEFCCGRLREPTLKAILRAFDRDIISKPGIQE